MKIFNRTAVILATLVFTLVAVSLASNTALSAQGYDIQFHEDRIDLMFPDGSVLHAPRDADLKSLDGVTATGGGQAQALLDQAASELGLPAGADLPKAFGLAQNYPNPFNPSTTIVYNIPEDAAQVKVVLTVYNIRGQSVKTLVDEAKGPGQYSVNWDGSDSMGGRVASGVYFYRIDAGSYHATRKMVILK